MRRKKLVRITTIPLSLEKLLEGQLTFMSQYFEVIAVSAEPERLAQYGLDNGVRVQAIPMTRKITPLQDLKAIYQLYRFLKRERPEIVHTHTPKAGMVGMIASKMAGVPHRLHTVAGLPLMEARGIKRWVLEQVEKWTYRMATMVYPNSSELRDWIGKKNWIRSERLKVLHNGSSNGIDTHYFSRAQIIPNEQAALAQNLQIPEDALVLVFVGRLVGDKGINELVHAFKGLLQVHEKARLLLVGPLETELDPLDQTTLKIIDSEDRIISVGYQQDVRPYFALSDVLTFPSYREGFPNVVLQAAAMELPAIVSDINGCNEIINQEINGLIVPVKDAAALRKAMERLLDNDTLRNKLKDRARASVVQRFDRKEFWQVLLQEYQGLF